MCVSVRKEREYAIREYVIRGYDLVWNGDGLRWRGWSDSMIVLQQMSWLLLATIGFKEIMEGQEDRDERD